MFMCAFVLCGLSYCFADVAVAVLEVPSIAKLNSWVPFERDDSNVT